MNEGRTQTGYQTPKELPSTPLLHSTSDHDIHRGEERTTEEADEVLGHFSAKKGVVFEKFFFFKIVI